MSNGWPMYTINKKNDKRNRIPIYIQSVLLCDAVEPSEIELLKWWRLIGSVIVFLHNALGNADCLNTFARMNPYFQWFPLVYLFQLHKSICSNRCHLKVCRLIKLIIIIDSLIISIGTVLCVCAKLDFDILAWIRQVFHFFFANISISKILIKVFFSTHWNNVRTIQFNAWYGI